MTEHMPDPERQHAEMSEDRIHEGIPTHSDVERTEGEVVIPSNKDERMMALFCHLGGAVFTPLVPLVIYAVKREDSPFLRDQGREALNFTITMFIGHAIGLITVCFTLGLVNLAVGVVNLVFSIIGGMEAHKGKCYRYPFNIPFIQ